MKYFSKKILIARTGIEAVAACRNNPNLDLVLMDIRMPKMDGNEATRRIRVFNENRVIIAQTAYAHRVTKLKPWKQDATIIFQNP